MLTHPRSHRRGVHGAVPGGALGSRPPITDIAPRLTGLSVSGVTDGGVFTWSATDDTMAALDACQYLSGGPCVEAAAEGELVETLPRTLLGEGRWELFATAAAAAGVQATMSLPVTGRTGVIGTVNLYGGSDDAFAGRRDELTAWCAHWPPAAGLHAVNAAFVARRDGSHLPEPHRDQNAVDWAVGVIAGQLDVDVAVAADRLTRAARHAGLPESRAAQLLNELLDPV